MVTGKWGARTSWNGELKGRSNLVVWKAGQKESDVCVHYTVYLADGSRERVGACWILSIGKLRGRMVLGSWMMICRNVTGFWKFFQDGFGQCRCVVYDSRGR